MQDVDVLLPSFPLLHLTYLVKHVEDLEVLVLRHCCGGKNLPFLTVPIISYGVLCGLSKASFVSPSLVALPEVHLVLFLIFVNISF